MRQVVVSFIGSAVLLLASWTSARAASSCYAGFEVSQACISERGLDQKVAAYQRKITEAMSRLGASYKIDLRVVNHPVEAGYNKVGDVFTDVVRNEEMRNQSFVINVTADFLEKQPPWQPSVLTTNFYPADRFNFLAPFQIAERKTMYWTAASRQRYFASTGRESCARMGRARFVMGGKVSRPSHEQEQLRYSLTVGTQRCASRSACL